jgi:hypothetical protein
MINRGKPNNSERSFYITAVSLTVATTSPSNMSCGKSRPSPPGAIFHQDIRGEHTHENSSEVVITLWL